MDNDNHNIILQIKYSLKVFLYYFITMKHNDIDLNDTNAITNQPICLVYINIIVININIIHEHNHNTVETTDDIKDFLNLYIFLFTIRIN